MKETTASLLSLVLLCGVSLLAQQPPSAPQTGGQRGQRGQREPLTPEQQAIQAAREAASGPNAVRPIDMLDSVWIEELSWMEVRDLIKAGKTTALIGSGGLEQNGPYEPTGKHNFTLQTTLEATARALGNALVAPIVTLEPGNPDREGLTPGSVFITQDTFRAILTDMTTSLKSMGFTDIVMVADSGGNPPGMIDVTKALNAKWNGRPARVFYIPEYYEEDKWSFNYLKQLGILQKPDVQSATRYDIHDDYHYESLVAVTNPTLIRPEQRIKAKKFSINGVEIGSVAKMVENGRKLAAYRATITVNAIKKAMATFKATDQ